MSKIDVQEIMREVRENLDRLQACKGHKWPKIEREKRSPLEKYTCTECKGKVGFTEMLYYVRGAVHYGGVDPNTISPEWPFK